jgi:hypothetical protein
LVLLFEQTQAMSCSPRRRQMRCTELMLIPIAMAMAAPVQRVACGGGPAKVNVSTRSAVLGSKGGMRDGRVFSRHSSATPAAPNRSFSARRTSSPFRSAARSRRCHLHRKSTARSSLATRAFADCSNSARSEAFSLICALWCTDSHGRVRSRISKRIDLVARDTSSVCAG